ncbi:MAG: hypothetical protein ACOX52_05320 [Verrucomicrobiota bacterium]
MSKSRYDTETDSDPDPDPELASLSTFSDRLQLHSRPRVRERVPLRCVRVRFEGNNPC